MHAPRRRTTAIVVGLTCCALVSGCGSSPSLLAAKRGDLAALRASVARERALCRLDRAEVRSLARATADRELAHAGPTDALVRIDEARTCSHALSDSLERLADRSD